MARRLVFSTAAAALAAACMSATDLTAVNAAVDQFHQQQANSAEDAIYQAAAPDLRASASLDDLRRIDTAVRNAQGCAAPGRDPNTWNNNLNTSGHFITVVFSRQCSGGPLVETFVFRMNGAQPLLMSYNASGMGLFPSAAPAPATASTTDATTTTAPEKPATP